MPLIKVYKVLHFEDDAKVAKKYRDAFVKAGFKYKQLSHPPKNMIRLIREIKPDLILMDTSMPNMDGFAAVELIKEHDELKDIPIVGLSDIDYEVGVRWAKNLSIYDYWLHANQSPQGAMKKIFQILHPLPQNMEKKNYKPGKKNKLLVLKIAIKYLLALLILSAGPLIIYFYNAIPDTENDFLTKFPSRIGVSIKANTYKWEYAGQTYQITKNFYEEINNYYQNHNAKAYKKGISLNDYYNNIFEHLQAKGDRTIEELVSSIKRLSKLNGLSNDEEVELIISFIQSIPFDEEKKEEIISAPKYYIEGQEATIKQSVSASWPRFPYEILFDNQGVCTDKTFLAIAMLKELGYGVALFDFVRHTAPAVKCTDRFSSYGSGYCFAEVTAPGFHIGEVPVVYEIMGQPLKKDLTLFSNDLIDAEEIVEDRNGLNVYTAADGRSYSRIINAAPILEKMRHLEREFNKIDQVIQGYKAEELALKEEADKRQIQINNFYNEFLLTKNIELFYEYTDLISEYNKAEKMYEDKKNKRDHGIALQNKMVDKYLELAHELNQ